MTSDGFDVDLEHLDEVTIRIRGYKDFLADHIVALESAAKELSSKWDGAAADAYSEAHLQFVSGMNEVHVNLGDLEALAVAAHANYSEAATANVKMLE
ncbi:WXG100 family type VII secretion target [Nocardia sp. NPDC057663]|uniref:WXG100 family type VII secretion target n=1 Tax=Nocardia sp. NPDC057663 TaxID=3346201 RepID=UPI00366C6A57